MPEEGSAEDPSRVLSWHNPLDDQFRRLDDPGATLRYEREEFPTVIADEYEALEISPTGIS